MIDEDLNQKIENFIMPFLKERGVELVELTVRRFSGQVAIEALVDKPRGGITIGECSTINRKIIAAMEVENFLDDNYILEVCSPGIDRPLTNIKDFRRAQGREVRVFLREPVAGKQEHEGIIENIEEENVVINCDDELISLPISKINQAKQIIGEG